MPYLHKQSLEIQYEAVNMICAFYNKETAVPPLNSCLLMFVSDIVPVGIIAGGTVGSCILLLMFLFALTFFLYRQRKGSKCTHLAHR